MKKDIHPQNHRPVIFQDTSSEARFLVQSTIEAEATAKWDDGNEYPLYKVEISSASHPFYTGERKEMDTAGRADKFRKRVAKAKTKTTTPAKEPVRAEKAGGEPTDAKEEEASKEEA